MKFNKDKIREDFPIIFNQNKNKKFVFLDNASTTHKPKQITLEEYKFYYEEYSSAYRNVYSLSQIVTNKIENIRNNIANFIHANSNQEIIFVKGTTEAINLIANSWGRNNINDGDNIIISQMEHHSNILPWILLSQDKKIIINIIPLTKDGMLDLTKINDLINKKTKLVALTHISNTIGTINPIIKIIHLIKSLNNNTCVLIDGAQAVSRQIINVIKMNCDFYVFSGHKMYGPTGIGVLYVKKHILSDMKPWQVGGGIVESIDNNFKIKYKKIPHNFEPGTPNIVGIFGLGKSIDYIKNIGINNIIEHENFLTEYLIYNLLKIPNVLFYGSLFNKKNRAGIISFNIKNYESYDIANLLDFYGISIRSGNLCAIPLMKFYNISSMCRVSLAIYNNIDDIDYLIKILKKIN